MKNKPENILVVRTDRIGDVVLTFPVAAILKKHYPNCKITFLLREYTAPLADENKFFDEVLILQTKNNKQLISENIKQLKQKKFDTCFVVSPNFQLALILRLSGIKNIIGTGYRWYSFLFNHKIVENTKYAEHHELEFNDRMLKAVNIRETITPDDVEFGFQQNVQSEQKVRQLLVQSGHNFTKKTVIIHPGSGGSAIDWPVKRFSELVVLLAQELDINIILTGSAKENVLCESLVQHEKVKNYAGRFNLKDFVSLLNFGDLIVANSTGPIHIAAALGKSVVGFYPKIVASSKKRWGPYSDKASVFNPAIKCSNCTRKQCEALDCMNSIEPVEVFESIKKMLGN